MHTSDYTWIIPLNLTAPFFEDLLAGVRLKLSIYIPYLSCHAKLDRTSFGMQSFSLDKDVFVTEVPVSVVSRVWRISLVTLDDRYEKIYSIWRSLNLSKAC